MRMYFDALMDRPITEEHYISPGAFVFNFNGKNIQFDFFTSAGGQESANPRWIKYELWDLDTDAFPEAEALLKATNLRNIKKIEEFFVYTGEDDEPEINLERIMGIQFELNGKIYPVPEKVIHEYNLLLTGELQKKRNEAELEER